MPPSKKRQTSGTSSRAAAPGAGGESSPCTQSPKGVGLGLLTKNSRMKKVWRHQPGPNFFLPKPNMRRKSSQRSIHSTSAGGIVTPPPPSAEPYAQPASASAPVSHSSTCHGKGTTSAQEWHHERKQAQHSSSAQTLGPNAAMAAPPSIPAHGSSTSAASEESSQKSVGK